MTHNNYHFHFLLTRQISPVTGVKTMDDTQQLSLPLLLTRQISAEIYIKIRDGTWYTNYSLVLSNTVTVMTHGTNQRGVCSLA